MLRIRKFFRKHWKKFCCTIACGIAVGGFAITCNTNNVKAVEINQKVINGNEEYIIEYLSDQFVLLDYETDIFTNEKDYFFLKQWNIDVNIYIYDNEYYDENSVGLYYYDYNANTIANNTSNNTIYYLDDYFTYNELTTYRIDFFDFEYTVHNIGEHINNYSYYITLNEGIYYCGFYRVDEFNFCFCIYSIIENLPSSDTSALEQQITNLQNQLTSLQEDYDWLLSDFNSLDSDYETLQSQFNSINSQYEDLLLQYDELMEDYDSVVDLKDSYKEQFEILSENFDNLSNSYDLLLERYNALVNSQNDLNVSSMLPLIQYIECYEGSSLYSTLTYQQLIDYNCFYIDSNTGYLYLTFGNGAFDTANDSITSVKIYTTFPQGDYGIYFKKNVSDLRYVPIYCGFIDLDNHDYKGMTDYDDSIYTTSNLIFYPSLEKDCQAFVIECEPSMTNLNLINVDVAIYQGSLLKKYNQGYNEGFASGYDKGITDGNQNSYNEGYNTGITNTIQNEYNGLTYEQIIQIGKNEESQANNTLSGMVLTIAETPITIFKQIWDFNVLGINITNIVMSLITLLLIIWLIKRLIK